jgi:hypothetical protein
MTLPTHEINRTVAALAAKTKSYPTVAGEAGGKLKPPRASRPRLPDAGSVPITSMRPMYGTRKNDDVLAEQHDTGGKGGPMVWLEVSRNGEALVKVDKARYDDWKRNTL